MLRALIRLSLCLRPAAAVLVTAASIAFSGCTAARTAVIEAPAADAALEVREGFAAAHRPVRARTGISAPGLETRGIAPYAVLANGARIDGVGMRSLVEDDSATARALTAASSHEVNANLLRSVGVVGMFAGVASVSVGAGILAEAMVDEQPMSDDHLILSAGAIATGLVLHGAGLIATFMGNDEEHEQFFEQEAAIIAFETDMRSRLKLPAEPTQVATQAASAGREAEIVSKDATTPAAGSTESVAAATP